MAYDGIFMRNVCAELQQCVGSRVEKIYQPSRDDIVMLLSGRDFSGKLLISVGSVGPRVQLTRLQFENPAAPPMFCMLMRKHFTSARLDAVRQNGLDRVLILEFSSFNEMGDPVNLAVIAEIMGRQSNVVMTCDGRIIDALHRVDLESAGRLILPGAAYELPQPQDKLDPLHTTAAELERRLDGDFDAKKVCACLDGVSPLIAREFCLWAEEGGLDFALSTLRGFSESGAPVLLTDENGAAVDFTYAPIRQYGDSRRCVQSDSFGELCDSFFAARQRDESIRRRTHELKRLVDTAIARISRKIDKQSGELNACEDREKYRVWGELIKANIYQIERGAPSATVVNYYDPDCAEVRIPLKAELSPAMNAQRYFNEYRKLSTAKQLLGKLIDDSKAELAYLESVADELTRAESDRELAEIKAELTSAGYLRAQRVRQKAPKALPPLHFVSDDGFDIYVGRNNRQNDELTLRTAAKSDIWLHTKSVHGTHTIIDARGEKVPPSTVMQAAVLAAYHSKARQSGSVAVDFCPVKHVKKPGGARPGMVIYDNYETLYVTPDEALVKRLKADE